MEDLQSNVQALQQAKRKGLSSHTRVAVFSGWSALEEQFAPATSPRCYGLADLEFNFECSYELVIDDQVAHLTGLY